MRARNRVRANKKSSGRLSIVNKVKIIDGGFCVVVYMFRVGLSVDVYEIRRANIVTVIVKVISSAGEEFGVRAAK